MHEFDHLIQKMKEFRPYLDENKMLFTYIAPKDREKFFKFLGNIYNSSASHSLYLRLSNPEVVRKLLEDSGFTEDTELEIYVSANDQFAAQWMNKSLKQYIEEKGIDFTY